MNLSDSEIDALADKTGIDNPDIFGNYPIETWRDFAHAIECEQQKRIAELEGNVKILQKALADSCVSSLSQIKREALQKAVEICKLIAPMKTYKAGGTATCRESDCYDLGIEECIETIKKEMNK